MSLEEYVRLFHLSRKLASLAPSHPHRLRHGGASADAVLNVQDLTIQQRGRWASIKSVARYRRPALYLRQLALLSPNQMMLAAAAESKLKCQLPTLLAPSRKRKNVSQ